MNDERPTVGSLFSGIGGIDLGLERAGFRVVWQCESDPYARAVLKQHWPAVPCYEDVRSIGAELARVDLLCGGFPCQDVSVAGKRAGIDGARSGLWGEFARLIRLLRPPFVLVENTPGLFDRGFGRVLGDLAALGYDAEWGVVSACALGAPHTRERVFVVAYPPSLDGKIRVGNGAPTDWSLSPCDHSAHDRHWWLEPFTGIRGVADGVPRRVERLSVVGNAVVPHILQALGRAILEAMTLSRRGVGRER